MGKIHFLLRKCLITYTNSIPVCTPRNQLFLFKKLTFLKLEYIGKRHLIDWKGNMGPRQTRVKAAGRKTFFILFIYGHKKPSSYPASAPTTPSQQKPPRELCLLVCLKLYQKVCARQLFRKTSPFPSEKTIIKVY